MACLIRGACNGDADELFCAACVDEVTTALRETPALLVLLADEVPRTLARPAQAAPTARTAPASSAPAREHVIDVEAGVVAAVADWSAITGRPVGFTRSGAAQGCAHLLQAPYRALAVLGGLQAARSLLRAVGRARQLVAATNDRIRLSMPCPSCRTKGLTRITEQGPITCDYCERQFLQGDGEDEAEADQPFGSA
jgi:ribosomal protein L37AE/L43A/copper chaperone CopZ